MSEFPHSSIVVHEVTEPQHWPPELLHVTASLSYPLARLHPGHLSHCAASLFEEVMSKLLHSVSEVEDDTLTAVSNIVDILDSMLVSVSVLHSFVSTQGDSRRRGTLPILASFFGILALACSKDAVLITDSPFLLSRSSAIDLKEDTRFEGRATILVSSYIPPKYSLITPLGNSDSYGCPSESESGDAPPEACLLPFDGPFDGHIIPGSGQRVDCVLPILCVANQDNIRPLVISTAYQRYAWGISMPVVGISIENDKFVATLVIGWICDGERTESPDLPTVHIASSISSEINSSLGVFDLSDPVSALQFSHFILSLRHQFSDIVVNTNPQRKEFCWRCDHSEACDSADPHSSLSWNWRDRILKWLKYNNPRFAELQDFIINDYLGIGNHSLDSISSHYSAASAPHSLDRFAKLQDSLLDDSLGINKWLWERGTIGVACIKMDEKRLVTNAEKQISEMIGYYIHILELTWPAQGFMMTGAAAAISCNAVYQNLLDLFFVQYKEYLGCCVDPIPVLSPEESTFFTSHLSICLSAVSLARHRVQQTLKQPKMRESFELLLDLFWSKEDDVSGLYLAISQDCRIQFASNKATQSILRDDKQAFLCDRIARIQEYSLTSDSAADLKRAIRAKRLVLNFKMVQTVVRQKLTVDAADRDAEPINDIADGVATAKVTIDCCGFATEILLPQLFVKFHDANTNDTKIAFRQCQMCCVSGVELLFSIGISEFPVYGLVVSGSRVSIMMENKAFGFNCIIDENIVTLDIAEPLDAFHFATVMHHIFLAGQHLGDVLKNKDPETIQELERRFFCRDSE
ncbi:hypothetical protein BDN70DRAFT_919689 [Pholiota conissans]|uniref:Uncharacterized protein n=1 Tax=Pholiota conissans TaxID=109636 RepID=A0A9P6D2Z9_9AGAR|nr:hypothetical protein BDN70DRAFT_919689 [Pholiota conissans]